MNRTYAFALGILSFIFVAGAMTACEERRSPLTSAPRTTSAQPSASPASTTEAHVASLRARGDDLRERGDYVQALAFYQSAVKHDPTDLGVRWALAQVLAQLNRRADAIPAYTWVLHNSLPGSEIARHAEQWLRDADGYSVASGASGGADAAGQGRLSGHLTWTALDPSRAVPSVSLMLQGTEAATTGQIYATRSVLNGDYEFTSVRAGGYRLVAKAQMVKIWETDVVITSGGSTVLNLDEAAAVAPADALLAKTSN